ncbi:nucleotidyltransferase domain-containing protein [Faecalicatena orotica]|uniref:Putative nucleotidyltransferase n=1 Tax=Faecalicatena orotica TaxID=1544 RepID=A0A2Y9BJL3_9FIRM|nr:nucleotidyltransferase domain-containing protein [Faecalicatena orotica]PWJ23396.1 putative nucleotidyltransferase [Faecalicatena orotica]SSA57654.1 Predicted nucleotidyltransferase [Faecalicatena orotica]
MQKNTHDILLEFTRGIKSILGNRLTKAILYGSYARGDFRENSDIDIMVLTTLTDEEIEKVETRVFDLAFDFQMDYGIDISVVIKNEDHFNYWLGAVPFYNNVQKEGVVLDE